jgi:hypothetical protein
MLTAFDIAAGDRRTQGQSAYIRFALMELIGVVMGAGKSGSRSYRPIARCAPDRCRIA